MFKRLRDALTLTVAIVALCSCSEEKQPRRETYPVTGEVYVDGKPAEQVRVQFHHVGKMDEKFPTVSGTFTGKDGKFAASTYEEGDGVPEGEYYVTFQWGQLNVMSMQYGGPDKLKDRYSDPKKSEYKIHVTPGDGVDMGRIELSTK